MPLEIVRNDITKVKADAIETARNFGTIFLIFLMIYFIL